ncbi:Thioesterase/thiol ester dehydrase-isomerase [Xylariaceae sp. FL0255]|nr:Thioesterase/thiol ester dehydrase-isomerase [Xylariaceae sp. FL0255]
MTSSALVQKSVAVARAPQADKDIYTNENPLRGHKGARSVAGGLLVGQAVSAASATVDPTFQVYSSQSSFIRPAQANSPVAYWVDRTADGRNFVTRTVRAVQRDECVYIAVISFRNTAVSPSRVLQYQIAKPDVRITPEEIPTGEIARFNRSIVDESMPILQLTPDEVAFDWRFIGLETADSPSGFRTRSFVRSPPLSTRDRSVHLAALAFLSDEFIFGIALFANPAAVGLNMKNISLGASLTHTVSFHDAEVEVDDWLIVERDTSWGDDGRVLVNQRMWNVRTGRLVISGVQEALVRLKDAKL